MGYSAADMAGDIDSRRSTSVYLVTFAGGAVAWQSRLQECVALSTTEAEFIATLRHEAFCPTTWFHSKEVCVVL